MATFDDGRPCTSPPQATVHLTAGGRVNPKRNIPSSRPSTQASFVSLPFPLSQGAAACVTSTPVHSGHRPWGPRQICHDRASCLPTKLMTSPSDSSAGSYKEGRYPPSPPHPLSSNLVLYHDFLRSTPSS
jgi:hypothetical protein